MQNKLDDGTTLYNEYTDISGFIIREILRTDDPRIRFQAGRHVMTPMRLPVYRRVIERVDGKPIMKNILTRHVDSDEIQRFQIHGYGRSREEALDRAANKLLRAEINAIGTQQNE